MAKHLAGDEGGDPDPFNIALTGPQVIGGPEPPQLSLAQAQAQLPLASPDAPQPALRADPNAPTYRPPTIGLRSLLGAVAGATSAPVAAALGSLVDKPGELGRAGLKAWEQLQRVPGALFQSPEAQNFPTASGELRKRGVDVGPVSALMTDLTTDPGNFLGGEGAATDLGKLGVLGAMALPAGVSKLREATKAAAAAARESAAFARALEGVAPAAKSALETLYTRYPNVATALAEHGPERFALAGRTPASSLDQIAQRVHDVTRSDYAISIKPFTGEMAVSGKDTGIMAGRYANQTKKTVEVPLNQFTAKDVKAFIEQHADEYAEHPDRYVGAWQGKNDADQPTVFLDVAEKHETPRGAIVSAGNQRQPAGLVRDPVTGKWPTPQQAVYDLKMEKEIPVGNLAEHLQTPEFQQRVDDMFTLGTKVMNGKDWWNLYGSDLERVYGKERVAPLAAMLASTSPASAPVHNLRTASEYLRRLIKGEDIVQPGFRIPETAVGHLKTSMGAMTPGDFNRPGTRMPLEQSRAGNLGRAAAGNYAGLQEDKVNDMFHALTGMDVGVYDRRYAKLVEDYEKGVYAGPTKDKLEGSMLSGKVGPYALIENAMRDAAKRHNMPLGTFTAAVWEGIGETIKRTGNLFGMKQQAHSIPEISRGFPGIFNQMVAEKAKAWGISVAEFEQRLRNGDAELLGAILATPVGLAAYRLYEARAQASPTSGAGPGPS
jgi:hypothetical protein